MNILFLKRILAVVGVVLFFFLHLHLALNHPLIGFEYYGDPIYTLPELLTIDDLEFTGWLLFGFHLLQFLLWLAISLLIIGIVLTIWLVVQSLQRLYDWLIVEPFGSQTKKQSKRRSSQSRAKSTGQQGQQAQQTQPSARPLGQSHRPGHVQSNSVTQDRDHQERKHNDSLFPKNRS